MSERQEKLSELEKLLMIFLADINEAEKTLSRMRNEAKELYLEINGELDIKEKTNE